MRSLCQTRRVARLRLGIFITVLLTSAVFILQHITYAKTNIPVNEIFLPQESLDDLNFEDQSVSGNINSISVTDAQFLPKWGNSAVYSNRTKGVHGMKWNHHKPRTSYLDLAKFINPSMKINTDAKYPHLKLRKRIELLNKEAKVQNLKLFPDRPENGFVIVVQVHKRLEYLVELLDSLGKARGIQDALLIISHDYYSHEMNQAVKAVNFCQVLQIFFPHSEQLYPDSYPGTDPNDCPRDLSADEAKRKGCNNAAHPDKYGHYREAKFVMTKHHWWWKANMVFDGLKITKHHPGPITFLEEDHYVAPDFVQMIALLHGLKARAKECQDSSCDILSLGMYVKPDNYQYASNEVTLTRWRSYDHNMGMTLYRSTWDKLKKCSKEFCIYDDYNWDWTLMYLSMFCLERPLSVLSLDMPRVFHIGECGMHHKDNCDTKSAVNSYKDLIERNKDHFFPQGIRIVNIGEGSAHVGIENGGWGDSRDHALCRSFNSRRR